MHATTPSSMNTAPLRRNLPPRLEAIQAEGRGYGAYSPSCLEKVFSEVRIAEVQHLQASLAERVRSVASLVPRTAAQRELCTVRSLGFLATGFAPPARPRQALRSVGYLRS
jgi:hypothetical protein